MDDFNKGFASSTSIKPSFKGGNKSNNENDLNPQIKGGNKSNNENELNPEMTSNLKSPRKKQLPAKKFMNPTISAAMRSASVPKKKILGERNETLETLEHQRSSSLIKSSVVDSDDDVEKDLVGKTCLQPYDPVKNYLSPRPKFLRYNPDRRRRILNLQENDGDHVKISTYFDEDLKVMPSSGCQDSCPQPEFVEEAQDVNNEENEDENCEEDDEEEMFEFREDKCCSLKGFFKILLVVNALILTTQAICLINSPTHSQTLESVWEANDWRNRVYGLNVSEVGYGLIREPILLVERWKEADVYDGYDRQEFVEVQNGRTENYDHLDEAENDDSDAVQDEILQEDEIKSSEVMKIDAETVDGLIEEDDSDAYEKNLQLTNDPANDMDKVENEDSDAFQEDEIKASKVTETEAETVDGLVEETANDMEDGAEEEFDDVKTNDVLIKFTNFDPTIVILLACMLLLTSFGAIHRARRTKVEKEEFKDPEPSENPQCMKEEAQFVTNEASLVHDDVSKIINHVHIPSVELLGEFVFGEEITSSNISPEIQPKFSHNEMSTGDSHTAKKQRRKNVQEVTTSSVSVRRSGRLKTRSSVISS